MVLQLGSSLGYLKSKCRIVGPLGNRFVKSGAVFLNGAVTNGDKPEALSVFSQRKFSCNTAHTTRAKEQSVRNAFLPPIFLDPKKLPPEGPARMNSRLGLQFSSQ